MRTLIRLAQVAAALILALCFVAAVSHGRALIWLAHVQLIGVAATALIRYMRAVCADPRQHEDDGWLKVLASCYGQELGIEYRSWLVQFDGQRLAAAVFTVPGMFCRHFWALIALIETGVTGECPAGW